MSTSHNCPPISLFGSLHPLHLLPEAQGIRAPETAQVSHSVGGSGPGRSSH